MKFASLIAFALLASLCASGQTNSYTAAAIVNNTQDVYLVNPWGLSRLTSSTPHDNEWWVSDNATGYTTLYFADKTGAQSRAGLVISVPSASGKGTGTPTGTAFNSATGPGPGANNFAFATLDGTISNWNAGQQPAQAGTGCNQCHVTTTTVMVNHSSDGAVYTGLAEATRANKPTFYAANNKGKVEAYDGATFAPVTLTGTFTDPKIPASYKAYGVQTIGSQIWVTYFNGQSGGYVAAYDVNGKLKLSLETGHLDEPWGVAVAPANFGAFSSDILVGNTTSGMIAAFNATTVAFEGYLNDSAGSPIVIPGLWGIAFGNGSQFSGPTNTLYYAAGGNTYTTGVFGAITAN